MKPPNPTASFRSEKRVAATEVPIPPYFLSPSTKNAPVSPKSLISARADWCGLRAGPADTATRQASPGPARAHYLGGRLARSRLTETRHKMPRSLRRNKQSKRRLRGGRRTSLGRREEQGTPLSNTFCLLLYHSP